jgi:hypothetical protein
MKLKNFFELFKDTIFLFDAPGKDGGKKDEMKSQLTNFGQVGPFAIFSNAYIFHVINKQSFDKNTVRFKSFNDIEEKYLSMDIIKVQNLSLKGNWRTPANYYNNFCSLEIELIE